MYHRTIEILKEHNIKVISTEENFDQTNIQLECFCGTLYSLTFKKIKVLKNKCCKACFSKKMRAIRSEIFRKKNVNEDLIKRGFIIVDGNYINQDSIFKFKCTSCDDIFERSAGRAFRTTTMCIKCSNYDNSYDDNTRIEVLKSRGVNVLEYISSQEIITKCKCCGEPICDTYNNSINTKQCKLCYIAITPLSIAEVESKLPKNITWVSGVYKNQGSIINVKCSCGKKFSSSVCSLTASNFGCKKCSSIHRSKNARITRENKGEWVKVTSISDKHLYYKNVQRITKQSISHYNLLDGVNLGIGGSGLYQVDHKFSKFYGFKYNIPPYIIGNIHNLDIITEKENSAKGRNCSITIEELCDKVFNKE